MGCRKQCNTRWLENNHGLQNDTRGTMVSTMHQASINQDSQFQFATTLPNSHSGLQSVAAVTSRAQSPCLLQLLSELFGICWHSVGIYLSEKLSEPRRTVFKRLMLMLVVTRRALTSSTNQVSQKAFLFCPLARGYHAEASR